MSWSIAPIPPTGLGVGGPYDEDPFGYVGDFRLARLHERLAATAIDVGATLVAPVLVAKVLSSVLTTTETVCSIGWCREVTSGPSLMTKAYVLALVLIVANSVVIQGLTGQSLGKRLTGLTLALPVESRQLGPSLVYPGVAVTLARFLALLCIDYAIFVGVLRPAWHGRRQTFGDSLLGTVVVAEPIELVVGDGPRR